MQTQFKTFWIRDWQPRDRDIAADLIAQVLQEYGLVTCGLAAETGGADWDVLNVEAAYWQTGGEFWVIEQESQVVGTAGYYPVHRGKNAVEIRKMYLLPAARRQGLGRYLLNCLETAIAAKGFTQVWLETASVLKEAVQLYESSGYLPISEVETSRCDRAYMKSLA
ncbi:MAG: GNAT family N-acetyltransferase [Elainella sp. Prado103]|jgi:putative acetyltransferase|nr:GNAT family N-acetyltransferase [Elainella sp. Prado103]